MMDGIRLDLIRKGGLGREISCDQRDVALVALIEE